MNRLLQTVQLGKWLTLPVIGLVCGMAGVPAQAAPPAVRVSAWKSIVVRLPGEEKSEKKNESKRPTVEERRKGSPDDTKPREKTFDDLKFEMERNAEFRSDLLTEEIEKLDSKRIKIRGYMLPSFQQDGITQFVLVRDNMECCFGPGAMLYDCIIVDMDEDKSATFSIRPITVEGVFTIEELKDEDSGMTLAIYHLQASEAK